MVREWGSRNEMIVTISLSHVAVLTQYDRWLAPRDASDSMISFL